MSDNGDGKTLIYKAELNNETKNIETTCNSQNIPALLYIQHCLAYDLTELEAKDRVKRDMNRVKIHAPNNIINRLRGKG